MHSPLASRVALFNAFDLPGLASNNPRIGSRPSNDRTTSSVASVQLLFTTNTSQFTPAGITSSVIASRPCRSNAHRIHVHTPIDTFIRASRPPFQSEAPPPGQGRERIDSRTFGGERLSIVGRRGTADGTSGGRNRVMSVRYDVIVIGAGHNGLVTAAYLARARRRVLVLERRDLVGGACVTEELWPGFKVSTAAYVTSLLRPEIIQELGLARHGLELLPRNPSSFTPFPDGRYLVMGPDREETRREVAKFSSRDADALPRYEAMLERVAAFIEPTLLMAPPSPWSRSPKHLLALARLGLGFLKLGADGVHAVEILTGAARRLLDRWFECDELKATLATDAIIGAMAAPSMPGTAYVLFHHVMGQTNGKRGVWGYVRGGMGGLTQALAAAARDLKVDIRCDSDVAQIVVKDGRASGVALADGTEIAATVVASNADAHITFEKLLSPGQLP